MYICVKNIVIFYVEFTKTNFFLPFHPSIFHSKIHKHTTCKMNRDKHGDSRLKIRSFEWTYFLNDPKVFLLQLRSYFNLQSNIFFFQLNAFIPFFLMENIFSNSLTSSEHFREWNTSIIYVKFELWASSFSTVKLKLRHKFSQLIPKVNFGFLNVGLWLCILPSFSQSIKEVGNWDLWKA